ncbi:MAG: hypothetical protein R2830_24540 [Saprospiraceae bacterium]
MKHVIIDTNVLLYALDKGNMYHQQSLKLLNDPQLRLSITSKNISEYFAVCSKFNVALKDALPFYHQIRQNTNVPYPSDNSLSIFETLLQKYQPKGNQVFDL